MFNPNELVLEKVRFVEEYDPATKELVGRYTQIEDGSFNFSAESKEVTDADGMTIMEFFKARKGTFSFTNSVFSLDLLASQFGSEKTIATGTKKLKVPVSEIIEIAADHTVKLKYIPVGVNKAEVKYVKVLNADNTMGKTYAVSPTPATDKFTINAATQTITMPNDVTGRVFVNYEKESENAVMLSNRSDGEPSVKELLVHVLFRHICNKNQVIAGVIRCPRAQIDPKSVEVKLTADGKHPASYVLQKEYCSEAGTLVDVIVSED
nr:MAG TPA: putative structural protein [Caudoviricetes sp.]